MDYKVLLILWGIFAKDILIATLLRDFVPEYVVNAVFGVILIEVIWYTLYLHRGFGPGYADIDFGPNFCPKQY